jgi:hypothetical protein
VLYGLLICCLIGSQVRDKHFFDLFARQCAVFNFLYLFVSKGVEAHSTAADLRQRPLAHSVLGPNEMEWHVE